MSLYLLLLPLLFVLVSLVARWRQMSLLWVALPVFAFQSVLLWFMPVGEFLLWAQSLQLIGLVTFAGGLLLNRIDAKKRLMEQGYFALFSFFSLAVLLMPGLWQQAAMAIISLLVLVVWFSGQQEARVHLGLAVINWFFTVVAMALSLHLFTVVSANIIGVVLMAIALLGLTVFYYYRYWLTLWFFCLHLGLALLLLWSPIGSSGLAVLLHLSIFFVALMFVSIIQYLFQESQDELHEYENGTIITLGFWRALTSINGYISRLRKGVGSDTDHATIAQSRFSWSHAFLLFAIMLLWSMPPTGLFLTTFLLFSQIVAVFASSYLLLTLILVVFVVFTILGTLRLANLWHQCIPVGLTKRSKALVSLYALLLLVVLIGTTLWLPDQFMNGLALIAERIN
jgi:hypothetical protein